MRETHTNRFNHGTHWYSCDRCDFDFYHNELIREARTGLLVCAKCWDDWHPKELQRRIPRSGAVRDIREVTDE